MCALLDLIFCALLSSPIAGAMYLTGSNLQDPQRDCSVGRNWDRCYVSLSNAHDCFDRSHVGHAPAILRVIDTKTGLIPTGGQTIGRSFLYLISLATVVGSSSHL